MKVLNRRSLWAAGMALIASLGSSAIARADLILTATETGYAQQGPTTLASGAPTDGGGTGVTYNAASSTFHDFTFTGITLSETQTDPLSEVLSSTLTIKNTNSVAHTLTFTLEATGFTAPLAPPGVLLLESLGGTTPVTGAGAGNTISFFSQAAATPAAPTLSPSITGVGKSYSQDSSESIATGLSGTYSVFQTYTITLNAGANLQFTGRTDLLPTPEPSSIALALTALPLLGLTALARRRRARA